MKKRVLALLLSLVLIFSCLPQMVLAESGAEAEKNVPAPVAEPAVHTHAASHVCEDCKTTEWTAWEKTTELPTAAGHYYLTGNVKITKRWAVSGNSQVVLCLNGYTIDANKTCAYEVKDTAKLVISDCTAFTDANGNYVAGTITNGSDVNVGGAFYVNGQGKLYMYGGKLTGHKNTQTSTGMGWSGGAIHVRGNGYLYLKDCEISGNTTSAEGGAICLRETGATGDTAASAYLENVTFKNNKADRKGGVMFLNTAKNSVTMKNCTFESNTCPGSGGVVYNNGGTVTVENCTFTGNSCGNGGGIFNSCDGSMTINGGTFRGVQGGNSAKTGGVFYLNKTASVTVNGGDFQGFTTSNVGGIAYLSDSSTYLLVTAGTFSGNQSRNGGVFGVEGKATFKITGGTVKNNTATNKAGAAYVNGGIMILEKAALTGNTAPNGGGIFTENGSTLTIRSGSVTDNTATTKGGGIFCTATTTFNLSGDPQIRGNQAKDATNNVQLPNNQVITLGTMSQGTGKVGITAESSALPYAFTTDVGSQSCMGYFFSDDVTREITSQAGKLVLVTASNHAHCACTNLGGDHCDHESVKWTPWLDGSKLPTTSGHYFLETDVKVTGRQTVSGSNDVYLCLNGHTIDSNKKCAYEVKDTAKLTVTDCGDTGSIVNGSDVNVGGAFYVQGSGQLRMFGGSLKDHNNTQTGTAYGWSGGAVHARGEGKVLLVGVLLENNTTTAEGGAIGLRGKAQLTLEGCTLKNNTAGRYGGAVYLAESGCSAVLTDCLFEGNTATANAAGAVYSYGPMTVAGCTFRGNVAKENGGAFLQNGKTLTVTDSTFTGNRGNNGGAGRITSGAAATFTGCEFTENTANANGGVFSTQDANMTLTDCKAGKNTANAGGAIYFQGKDRNLILTNTDFTENTAANGGGGAVILVSGSALQLKGGLFENNICTGNNGGGVYVSTNGSMTMENATFRNNTGLAHGGGIYLLGASLTVESGTFTGNRANDGAAIAGRGGVRTVDGQEVRDVKSTFIMNGGTITGNIAKNSGGGVLINGIGSAFTMNGGEITGNTTANGGGVIAQTEAVIYLNDGKITENKATAAAGGVYVSYTAALVMNGGTISNNQAGTSRGGGIFLYGGNAELKGGTVENNSTNNYGGGIGGNNTNKNDTNYRPQVTLCGTLVQNNRAAAGGGGIATSGADIVVSAGKITGNSTEKSAGGLALMSGSTLKLTGGEISKNTAGITCGGLYMNGESKFTMEGGTITGNTSTNNGAGMYMEQGTADLSGGTISYNTSYKGSGGGAYFTGSNVKLRGTSITGNSAKSNGGGFVVSRYKNTKKGLDIMPVTTIAGSTISNNFAEGPAGGILLMSPGTTTFVSGRISGNESKGNGGGIYVSTDHTFNMQGGTVSGNKSGNQGAGVYHLASKGNYTGGTVTKNVAFKNGGGFVFTGASQITMKELQVVENEAWLAGAFIINNSKAVVTAENCDFSRNQAVESHGGAIYAVWGSTGTLKNCTITENTAKQRGGAIATDNGAIMTLEGCTITGNTAGTEGGAVRTRAPLTFLDCTIANNTAGENGGGIFVGDMGTTNMLHPVLTLQGCTLENNETDQQGGALYQTGGSLIAVSDTVMTGNVSKLEGSAIWAVDDLSLVDVTVTGNTSKSGGYAIYYNDAEYDGYSYYRGFYKMDGQMIVKDNEGGNIYMGSQVAISVGTKGLTGDTHMEIDLHSGVLTQLLYGAYDYEGGDCTYTVTAGDRSLTDPEEGPAPLNRQNDQKETANTGDILLYTGIGVVGVAAIAAILLILKKKKSAPAEKN